MKVVIDTNVLASGVFWSGPPLKILEAFLDGKINIVVSEEIFYEYSRVLELLGDKYKKDTNDILNAIKIKASWNIPVTLCEQVCKDVDDDKFIACAISAGINTIVSGDKLLLACTGYNKIAIITPKQFVEKYLSDTKK